MQQSELIEEQRRKTFPMELPNGVTARCVSLQEMFEFVGRMWGEIMGGSNESRGYFQTPQDRQAVEQRLQMHYMGTIHHELIIGRDKSGKDIGWFVGEMEEHQTFYLRTAGVLPGVRRQGFLADFMPRFQDYLRSLGYERITSQHHPNNIPVIIGLLKQGFCIAGMEIDERYGPLIKTIKYLHEDRRAGYESAYRLPDYAKLGAPSKPAEDKPAAAAEPAAAAAPAAASEPAAAAEPAAEAKPAS